MGSLSHALAAAKLISPESVARQAAIEVKQTLRKEKKKQRKRYRESDEGRVESYSSPAELMEDARQRLKEEGYSDRLMGTLFREAHKFADAKLVKKQRNRMHAFLCQVQEILQGADPVQQQRILRDGKKAFQHMNAKHLDC